MPKKKPKLNQTLESLEATLDKKFDEINALAKVTAKINSGLVLGQVLDQIYDSFKPFVPYDHIGLALFNENNTVHSVWTRSEAPEIFLKPGYQSKITNSSLSKMIESKKPRIINDLEAYYKSHPTSESTSLILKEGILSSLTCPLIAGNKPIGFIFFSSKKKHVYNEEHVGLFVQISGELSLLIEKGQLYKQLIELNQIKHKFLGLAIHDLQNPLMAVAGYNKLLLEEAIGPVTETQKDILTRMEKGLNAIKDMLSEILDVSIFESIRLIITKESVDLDSLLQEVKNQNQIIADSKNIEILIDINYPLPPLLLDPSRIMQVFDNLISNAIKYSFPKTKIFIEVKHRKNEILFSVTDQGQGIPENDIPKLFKEFGRATVFPTGGERSTGLGLVIVKHIVNAHGGDVFVRSLEGRGSTFSFTLPAEEPAE